MSRPMRAGEEAVFAQIVNDEYARQRLQGALPEFITDWTANTVTTFPGDKWVHPNTGPIISVAVSTIQTLRGEQWQAFHILAVKEGVANREAASLKVLADTVADSAARGAVGATCSVSKAAVDLVAFLQSWSTAVIEDNGTFVQAWMRHQVGFPEWKNRA